MSGHRKSIRLKDYDYTYEGAYFVTVCVHGRRCVLGHVKNGEMVLNDAGKMVADYWMELPKRFSNVEMDEYMVMPNHLHGIIVIAGSDRCVSVGAPLVGALNNPAKRAGTRPAPTLGEMIGAFKSLTTNEYIRNVKTKKWPAFRRHFWQRNFYEHVIRNEFDLNQVREYILNNPAGWETDEYYSV